MLIAGMLNSDPEKYNIVSRTEQCFLIFSGWIYALVSQSRLTGTLFTFFREDRGRRPSCLEMHSFQNLCMSFYEGS
jgi:hypothetical protein